MLKSQDVLIALKLASIHLRSAKIERGFQPPSAVLSKLIGWEPDPLELAFYETTESPGPAQLSNDWTYASLSKRMGISASECNEAVKRCLRSGLLRTPRSGPQPVPVAKALLEFLIHGLKYAFPAEEGAFARGIPTGFAAPVLVDKLLSAGEHVHVWPDARGNNTGLALQPLHKAVPFAVRYDVELYGLLALIDAIRFGKLREVKMASEMLTEELSLL